VGLVRDALVRYSVEQGVIDGFILPVVGETWDGWLNDIDAFSLTEEDARAALASARPGPVPEGNVGGGTGMICHDFKGGIGTSSRCARAGGGTWVVGALVQANYGDRADLRLDGLPLGRLIGRDRVPGAYPHEEGPGGSIIVIVATDAPLLPTQCARLARRATIGLARAGGMGHNGSGDLFLAFATGNHLPAGEERRRLEMLDHEAMNPLFTATAEAVEEAILNALCAAETMTGHLGRTAHALPLDAVAEAWATRAR
jgi:D-aminopeptidase